LDEDGSPNGGLETCQQLAQQYSKIKLLRHPNGCNMGPSASRNLGIKNAIFEYVAFLDADDYYIRNRFKKTIEVIKSNTNNNWAFFWKWCQQKVIPEDKIN
jgi:glycosyltransferase involved in cell wall biosynthesis